MPKAAPLTHPLFPLMLVPVLLAALLTSGCLGRTGHEQIARTADLAPTMFSGENFDMLGYARGTGSVLHVYIEGDGRAWRTPRRPATDPTPTDPVGLRLAATDTHDAVFYLSRPCQYVRGDQRRNCTAPLWTSARFSEPVVAAMNAFLDQAKTRAGADRLKLLGYSGGGCIALLLAQRRTDVDAVVTVAGNVDHAYWTRLHKVSPLRNSLNPLDDPDTLRTIPQLHIVSHADTIMPPQVAAHYLSELGTPNKVEIVTVDNIVHDGNWQDLVPGILAGSGVW